jgi:hypothetical protein
MLVGEEEAGSEVSNHSKDSSLELLGYVKKKKT